MNDLPTAFSAATSAIQNRNVAQPVKTADAAEARTTAEEFEALFLAQVLGDMFKGIKTDGPFGGGHGEDMYRGLMMQEYGKAIAANGGIGIADAVMREILTTQEAS